MATVLFLDVWSNTMPASLKGKSVIVTGGSKGIGKGIARVFAGHDAKALIVARHLKDAEAAAQALSKGGATVGAFAADVTKPADMEAMAKAAVDRHGGLDVLCANAGIFPQAKIEEMSPESWDDVMNTNLKGTFLVIKACVPHLKKSIQGRILITSSITGPVTGYPGGPITARRRRGSSASCAPPASSWRNTASR
jgi:3-oxoacyl-[acyl-carrier protein] reductase